MFIIAIDSLFYFKVRVISNISLKHSYLRASLWLYWQDVFSICAKTLYICFKTTVNIIGKQKWRKNKSTEWALGCCHAKSNCIFTRVRDPVSVAYLQLKMCSVSILLLNNLCKLLNMESETGYLSWLWDLWITMNPPKQLLKGAMIALPHKLQLDGWVFSF